MSRAQNTCSAFYAFFRLLMNLIREIIKRRLLKTIIMFDTPSTNAVGAIKPMVYPTIKLVQLKDNCVRIVDLCCLLSNRSSFCSKPLCAIITSKQTMFNSIIESAINRGFPISTLIEPTSKIFILKTDDIRLLSDCQPD